MSVLVAQVEAVLSFNDNVEQVDLSFVRSYGNASSKTLIYYRQEITKITHLFGWSFLNHISILLIQ